MTALSRLSPPFAPGTVWLVGAGPGDPGLLTIHALNALAAADVIVYDALVDPAVLSFARESAELEFAGKRGGRPSAAQRDICERLIQLARQGKRVLRLKGGDPFIFGRGGEEALALSEADIPFRIIPGVSSGLASLAIHGVPATVRKTNHAVILATGHPAPDAQLEWASLARTGAPIVLYMAVSSLPSIVQGLMEGGLSGDTPALAVHGATTAKENVVEGTLASLPKLAEDGLIRSPAIVAIGAIAAFRSAIANHLLEFASEAAQ
ncbi:uroporphyrin-III C-methyltransferase [Microvirga flocculans]|uniref:uroporphyrinogen-III C-methyltransferase n=1 Tax=Microvirga flocculans TaxID=217168 RepID=A0A7W6IET9_9HYPH|nr:uroporphyrinogen-III C-methyltransferase [Microvirga flocculans]MBB4039554.1 uroporphyrin-III C-methyltransferase [Microvirga flocculans]